MYREIVHIYGPFSIHSFGVMIVTGLFAFLWRAQKHPLRIRYMSADALLDIVIFGICCGIIGGRLLYVLTEWHTFTHWTEALALWEGGFSLLGSVAACALCLPFYLRHLKVPVLPCLDLVGIHAPLLQSISRIGCFLAGCCYGTATTVAWGVTYMLDSNAPTNCTSVHPTQLYSAGALLCIFFILNWLYRTYPLQPGQLFGLYLMLTNIERFSVDFFRGDREFYESTTLALFSAHQWLALGLCAIGCMLFFAIRWSSAHSRPL